MGPRLCQRPNLGSPAFLSVPGTNRAMVERAHDSGPTKNMTIAVAHLRTHPSCYASWTAFLGVGLGGLRAGAGHIRQSWAAPAHESNGSKAPGRHAEQLVHASESFVARVMFQGSSTVYHDAGGDDAGTEEALRLSAFHSSKSIHAGRQGPPSNSPATLSIVNHTLAIFT
ncbi:hypothetical protein S7711_11151 [Stachybotrys chartarum IBT 7711]|uniref:Uncharacterized protein n=1 Tax=Stachybotrys chartarum (strain CBS 109288 / IBT 7711) TaxID=1280523 RepID=A0A084AFN8_STACB|nr:hypothetical protein S7711_11151 [Stachybotrys chartarum IBT 7711]KFA50970.1 hypothetical protein S40293_10632 [Stachybotrys chartarum IBT 40293]KFA74895.1 hypothetical protein S40288_11146 [Stachybotrys chartarum IBT 40288]